MVSFLVSSICTCSCCGYTRFQKLDAMQDAQGYGGGTGETTERV